MRDLFQFLKVVVLSVFVSLLVGACGGYRYLSGAFKPRISGHGACFFILTSREHLPLRCLNFNLQSVKGFVRLRIRRPLSQSLVCSFVLKPFSDLSLALKCELKSSMRFVLPGQFEIVL